MEHAGITSSLSNSAHRLCITITLRPCHSKCLSTPATPSSDSFPEVQSQALIQRLRQNHIPSTLVIQGYTKIQRYRHSRPARPLLHYKICSQYRSGLLRESCILTEGSDISTCVHHLGSYLSWGNARQYSGPSCEW